ncbi:2,3-bisphosphoglycerate-dependent phosphoglycerate mutase [Paenibacillus sp. UNC499MF]|nr:2,3-bisphosphoglycerate-dependent phosphoglycerate mutase [Paenibacillus sp. UNC499MF]
MVLIMNYLDKKFDFTFWKQLDMPDIYKLSFDNRRLIEVKRIWDKGQEKPDNTSHVTSL